MTEIAKLYIDSQKSAIFGGGKGKSNKFVTCFCKYLEFSFCSFRVIIFNRNIRNKF